MGPSNLSDIDSEIRNINPKIDLRPGRTSEGENEEEKRLKDADSHICVFPYEIGERLFSQPLTTGKVCQDKNYQFYGKIV